MKAEDFLADISTSASKGISAESFLSDLPSGTNNQSAGPIPTASGVANYLFPRKSWPATAGGTIAGLVTGGNPLAVGVGSALGEGVKQATEFIPSVSSFFKEQPPQSLGQSVKNIGIQGALGVLSGIIGRGAEKAFSPFSSAVTPEIQAQTQAAISEGIRPPVSAMTQSGTVQAMERTGEISPFGSFITKQRSEATAGLEAYANRISGMIAPYRQPEVTGNLAKQALEGLKQNYENATGKLYNQVIPLLRDSKVDLPNTVQKMQDIISRRTGEAEPAGLEQVRTWLKNIVSTPANDALFTGGENGSIQSFQQLRNFRTNVGQKINFSDPASSGMNLDLKDLYGAISKDLKLSAYKVSPEIGRQLDAADEMFAQGRNTLKSNVFKNILNSNPSTAYKAVISPNNPEQALVGKEMLGDNFKDIQRQWFEDILNNSKIRQEGQDIISPTKLATNLHEYGTTIQAMFDDNPQLSQQFNKLQDISLLLGRGNKVTQGSQTAFIGNTIAQLTAPIFTALGGNPSMAFKMALGVGAEGAATGLGFGTNLGRQYLTTGFPTAGRIAGGLVQPASQLGLSGALNNNQSQ